MMTRLASAMLATLVLVARPAQADLTPVSTGTIRHDRPDSSYVTLGEMYPSVGMLLSTAGGLCSGTLIGPNWVLTAAHCVSGASAGDFTYVIGGSLYSAQAIYIEPTWNGSLYAGNDIALLELIEPVLNVTPASYSAFTNEVGQIGTWVGFGSTGTGATGVTSTDFMKRAGQNVLDVTADFFNEPDTPPGEIFSDRILISDFDEPGDPSESFVGSELPLDLEFNVAPGDSGGALFVDFGWGDVLVGVTSFMAVQDDPDPDNPNDGNGIDADYGDGSGATRTSQHVAFIQGITGIAPAAVPEPSSTLLLLIAGSFGAGLGWRRRVRCS